MRYAPRPLQKLERTIAARAAKPNEKSYTSQLLAGGVEKIGAKVIEEAAEVVEAAREPGSEGREHFIREVGDLFYHLLVLMQDRSSTLDDVEAELSRRFGVSGLQEKASRSSDLATTTAAPPKKTTSTKTAKPKTARKKAAPKKTPNKKRAKRKS